MAVRFTVRRLLILTALLAILFALLAFAGHPWGRSIHDYYIKTESQQKSP